MFEARVIVKRGLRKFSKAVEDVSEEDLSDVLIWLESELPSGKLSSAVRPVKFKLVAI